MRIRSITPEFWSSARLAAELTFVERLFYIGLWGVSNDQGKFVASVVRLRGELFPYDESITDDTMRAMLGRLSATGRLVLYEVNGTRYGLLTKFAKYQKPQHPTADRLPDPIMSCNPHEDLMSSSRGSHEQLMSNSGATHVRIMSDSCVPLPVVGVGVVGGVAVGGAGGTVSPATASPTPADSAPSKVDTIDLPVEQLALAGVVPPVQKPEPTPKAKSEPKPPRKDALNFEALHAKVATAFEACGLRRPDMFRKSEFGTILELAKAVGGPDEFVRRTEAVLAYLPTDPYWCGGWRDRTGRAPNLHTLFVTGWDRLSTDAEQAEQAQRAEAQRCADEERRRSEPADERRPLTDEERQRGVERTRAYRLKLEAEDAEQRRRDAEEGERQLAELAERRRQRGLPLPQLPGFVLVAPPTHGDSTTLEQAANG